MAFYPDWVPPPSGVSLDYTPQTQMIGDPRTTARLQAEMAAWTKWMKKNVKPGAGMAGKDEFSIFNRDQDLSDGGGGGGRGHSVMGPTIPTGEASLDPESARAARVAARVADRVALRQGTVEAPAIAPPMAPLDASVVPAETSPLPVPPVSPSPVKSALNAPFAMTPGADKPDYTIPYGPLAGFPAGAMPKPHKSPYDPFDVAAGRVSNYDTAMHGLPQYDAWHLPPWMQGPPEEGAVPPVVAGAPARSARRPRSMIARRR
jgi:hypothetical protein